MATQTAAGAAIPTPAADGHLTGFGAKPYRSYVLSALLLVYILNFLDRGLLGVVELLFGQQPLRRNRPRHGRRDRANRGFHLTNVI